MHGHGVVEQREKRMAMWETLAWTNSWSHVTSTVRSRVVPVLNALTTSHTTPRTSWCQHCVSFSALPLPPYPAFHSLLLVMPPSWTTQTAKKSTGTMAKCKSILPSKDMADMAQIHPQMDGCVPPTVSVLLLTWLLNIVTNSIACCNAPSNRCTNSNCLTIDLVAQCFNQLYSVLKCWNCISPTSIIFLHLSFSSGTNHIIVLLALSRWQHNFHMWLLPTGSLCDLHSSPWKALQGSFCWQCQIYMCLMPLQSRATQSCYWSIVHTFPNLIPM